MNLNNILPYVTKPARYIGGEVNSNKTPFSKDDVNVCLAFPDVYEIGMSHLGYKIIYHMLNNLEGVSCERVFSPWPDMADKLKENDIELFSLETRTKVKEFDILGFSLAYELSYTNILQVLDLAKIPFKAKDRDDSYPLVIAGGTCVFNPEPIADFFDFFIIGDAERVLGEIAEYIKSYIAGRLGERPLRIEGGKQKLLAYVAKNVKGVYVPSMHSDFRQIEKSMERDLDNLYFPTKQIVPHIQAVHDRASIEIMRGCPGGCRFCQATAIYRPVRHRSLDLLLKQADELIENTGYEEIGLLSLSSADYPDIYELIELLSTRYKDKGVSLSLPSLKINSFTPELAQLISKSKKTGLTFAIEAGSERLRKNLNKKVDIEKLYQNAEAAKKYGWKLFKLYFMIGLPEEQKEDIDGIIEIAKTMSRYGNINLSIANFVPKMHTPFEKEPMAKEEYLKETQEYILDNLKQIKRIKIKFHDINVSMLENVLSRGDRGLADNLIASYENGCVFSAWREFFDYHKYKMVEN